MSSAATADLPHVARAANPARYARWTPLSGIAFVVFFVAGVVASSPPSDSASDAKWVASYTGHGNQVGHVLTGVFLILAGLSFVSFVSVLWTRISEASRPAVVNPLPLVTAGVAAACIAAGGVLMAAAAGASLTGSSPVPGPDLLRFSDAGGFTMVGIAGMLAAALCVACLSAQARAAGIFGRKLTILGLVASVVLLASFLFIPIVALLVWLVAASIVLMRSPAGG